MANDPTEKEVEGINDEFADQQDGDGKDVNSEVDEIGEELIKINKNKEAEEIEEAAKEEEHGGEQAEIVKKEVFIVPDTEENAEEEEEYDKKQEEMAQQLEEITKKLSRVQSMLLSRRGSYDSFLDDSDLEADESFIMSHRSTRGGELKEMLSDFGALPDLNEISLESLVSPVKPAETVAKKVETVGKPKDKGHFVDPITGESIHSISVEEEAEEVEEEEESGSEEEEPNLFYTVDEDDDILTIMKQLDEENFLLTPQPTIEEDSEKAMAQFFEEIQIMPESALKGSNSEILRQLAIYEQQKKLTHDFLNALITRVVNMVEYKDEKAILRKNLDKRKLLNKMLEYISDLRIDRKYSNFLNGKVVEYFRRRKLFRNINEGNVDEMKDEKEKYHASLAQVDTVLGYEENAKINKIFIESKLENRIKELTEMVTEAYENFEDLIRRAFIRSDASEKYVTAINNLIRKLRRERKEVTDFRKNLILRQSLVAELHEQLEKLECLGEGLSLSEYNHKLTETIGLTKLVDEREYQTGVMRKRCHEALHTVTHMVENISMEKASVQIEYNALNEAKKERKRLREKMYRLKLEHIQILQETASVHEASGLISKPSVLMDYDRISEYIPTIRQRVNKLHRTQAKLSERVNILSKECENRNL